MLINNFTVDFSELFRTYSVYNSLFFFCKQGARTVIEMSVKRNILSLYDYNPCLGENDCLYEDVIKLLECYVSKAPEQDLVTNFLMNGDFAQKLESAVEQVNDTIDYLLATRLPNPIKQVKKISWMGDYLILDLRLG